jgi:signal transduction histidine kinase
MNLIFSNRKILLFAGILLISNILITGVPLIILSSKSIHFLETNLEDIVERQKSLVTSLYEDGKSEQDIVRLIKKMRAKYYVIGTTGEITIAKQVDDSVKFLLASSAHPHFIIKNGNHQNGMPMLMAVRGNSGYMSAKDYKGVDVYAAYTYIPELKWGIVAKISKDEIKAPFYEGFLISISISIILIFVTFFAFIVTTSPLLKAIVKSELLYRRLFENMFEGLAYCKIEQTNENFDYRFLKTNPSFDKIIRTKDIEGKKVSEVFPNYLKHDKEVMAVYEKVVNTGNSEVFETYAHEMNKWFLISVYSPEKGHFVTIRSDITERKEAEMAIKEQKEEIEAQNEEYKQINDELNIAKEHAEESDRLKTAFLQNMSHEIRTPMNAIMGFSELITSEYNNHEKLEQYSNIIHQRCNDLLDMINEILDIAKIESGQLPVNMEECDLYALFTELSQFFRENQKRLKKPNLNFNIDIECITGIPCIVTDKLKLKQIFINLIGNAFKFTDEGEIRAGFKLDEHNNIIFYVKDTGIGIPPEKQEYIFQRFAQLDYGNNRLYGGTGLGLSIVKGLVTLLDGKIWLESDERKGTTFYFNLAYTTCQPRKVRHTLSAPVTDYNFDGKRVLIVEDDVYNAKYLEIILNNAGFNTIHTEFGYEAIQIAHREYLDLILMDISLPDVEGYDVTRKIKSIKPDFKIIAQTAYAGSSEMEKAILAGCDDYISKPISRNALLSKVYNLINKTDLPIT